MATESNSAIAAEHNIIVYRGDTFERELRYWNDIAKTDPVILAGSTFKLDVIQPAADFPFVILSFAIGTGITITPPNILTLSKTAVEMQVKAGEYLYDLQKTTGTTVVTIMRGTFTVIDDETK